MSRPPLGNWQSEQARLHAETAAIKVQNEDRAYQAGRQRGTAGQIQPPPWMEHLHEIVPHADPVQLAQFAHAHHYGQVEGYVETEPDRIEDEFRPQAEHIANKAKTVSVQLENAKVAYGARGLVALAGHSRYPIAPTRMRAKRAQGKMNEVNDEAEQLHGQLTQRLGAVDELRSQLEASPWQPRHKR